MELPNRAFEVTVRVGAGRRYENESKTLATRLPKIRQLIDQK